MAKPLIVEKNGQLTSFDVSLLERRKLYGSRKRVALDPKAVSAAVLSYRQWRADFSVRKHRARLLHRGWWMDRTASNGADK